MQGFPPKSVSGKSLVLQEIEQAIQSSYLPERSASPGLHIVDRISLAPLREEDLLKLVGKEEMSNFRELPPEQSVEFTLRLGVSSGVSQLSIPIRNLQSKYLNSEANDLDLGDYFGIFASALILRLDGTTRLSLIEPKPSGDLMNQATNHLVGPCASWRGRRGA